MSEKVKCLAKFNAFIKDHKENFVNNPKCRLINPAIPELGVVSKSIIENINKPSESKHASINGTVPET